MTPEEWRELAYLFSPEGWRELIGDGLPDDAPLADIVPIARPPEGAVADRKLP